MLDLYVSMLPHRVKRGKGKNRRGQPLCVKACSVKFSSFAHQIVFFLCQMSGHRVWSKAMSTQSQRVTNTLKFETCLCPWSHSHSSDDHGAAYARRRGSFKPQYGEMGSPNVLGTRVGSKPTSNQSQLTLTC